MHIKCYKCVGYWHTQTILINLIERAVSCNNQFLQIRLQIIYEYVLQFLYVAQIPYLVWISLPLAWHILHLLLVLLFSNAQVIEDAWIQWSVIFDTLGLRCVKFHRYTKLRTWRSAAGEKCKGGNGFDKLACKKLRGRHLMEKHKSGSIVQWAHTGKCIEFNYC